MQQCDRHGDLQAALARIEEKIDGIDRILRWRLRCVESVVYGGIGIVLIGRLTGILDLVQ